MKFTDTPKAIPGISNRPYKLMPTEIEALRVEMARDHTWMSGQLRSNRISSCSEEIRTSGKYLPTQGQAEDGSRIGTQATQPMEQLTLLERLEK